MPAALAPASPSSPDHLTAVAIGLALLVIALQWLPGAALLEYRREALIDPSIHQPWRLLSAHWVHLSWRHAGLNALALLLVVAIFKPWLTTRRLIALLLGANLFISAALFLGWPAIAWYRGLSGSLNAVFVAGAVLWLTAPTTPATPARQRWLPALLLLGVAAKILIERSWTAELPVADWLGGPMAPQAHLAGAVFGLLAAGWIVLRQRR